MRLFSAYDCFSSSPLISKAFEDFIAEKKTNNLSPASMRGYNQSYRIWKEYCKFTAKSTTAEISKTQIISWIASMQDKQLSAHSINHYLTSIRVFLYWCMDCERGYVPEFKIKLQRVQEAPPKHYADEDVSKLLSKPKKSADFIEWRNWAFMNWELATGTRASSVCNVRIGDIDFSSGEITIRHTKNKRALCLPLSSALSSALKGYIKIWRAHNSEEDFLFPNVGERQLTVHALQQSFKKYANNRGVEQSNIHGLRHTFARYYILNGGSVFKLQDILGHSSIEMTRRYVKLYGEDLKIDYDVYSPLDTLYRKNSLEHKVKRA